MITMQPGLKDFKSDCMLLQVHDELVFQVKESDAKELSVKVKALMENAVKPSVPIKVSVGSGKNWGDAH